jgi:hypothetical protein
MLASVYDYTIFNTYMHEKNLFRWALHFSSIRVRRPFSNKRFATKISGA